MIKGISPITNIGKKATMTALFAGLMTLGAGAANLNKQSNNTTTPTELVSKDAAAAMKANAISPQTTTQTVPDTHNIKLDNTLRKFIETDEDKEYVESVISGIYKGKGIFLGSVLLQNEIDMQNVCAFMTNNTNVLKNGLNPELGKKIDSFGPAFSKTTIPNEKAVTDWLFKTYIPYVAKALKFDHRPTAKEVSERLDSLASKIGFDRDDIIDYHVYSDGFVRNKLHNNKTQQNLSAYVAHKMFMIDRLMVIKSLRNSGVFGDGSFVKDNKGVNDYYIQWMESAQPKGE